ncbi:hypothetical protein MVEN_00252600 [Mycena venus]|uniref:Uncharacterized protein n=1 Tax=Mycena venus TaxID=2733690 RepID=A0A8H7DBD6_9AGAR|nr:hypothetical protein MVEN_00252600 [Mycena venus]
MFFKKSFLLFVLAAVLSTVSSIPVTSKSVADVTDSVGGTVKIDGRAPRHGDSRSRSRGRRNEIEARMPRHGDSGRSHSRGRRAEIEARVPPPWGFRQEPFSWASG